VSGADQIASIERAGPLRRAVEVWFPVLGGIGAWTVHLMFLASWAPHGCRTGQRWPMHLATLVLSLVTIAAGVLGARLIRVGGQADTEDASGAGRLRFLGELAVLIDIISLALILLEGLYAAVLPGCG
jgi:hypothetical protein